MSYDVSVIVTTKNEESHIEDCLRSIRLQNYPADKIEIIVVDNNSTDKTKEIAARYTDKVFDHGPERSAQRNFGINKAAGDYVLYLDADMTLSPQVVGECLAVCRREVAGALYIPEVIRGEGFWGRVRNFERSFYNATCIDAVRFVSRQLVCGIGGFDENLTGPEDWDFDRRLRLAGKASIIRSVIYHDEGRFNLPRYLAKKEYYRQWFDKYRQKWGRSDRLIRKQLGISYRCWGVFTENGKWKRLLRHPCLSLGMYYLRCRVGMGYVAQTRSIQTKDLIYGR